MPGTICIINKDATGTPMRYASNDWRTDLPSDVKQNGRINRPSTDAVEIFPTHSCDIYLYGNEFLIPARRDGSTPRLGAAR